MSAIESFIAGSEKLTGIFSYWPSFHDAEVVDLHLWRGNVDRKQGSYVFPVLTLTMHCWELTREVDAKGHFVLRHHTRATLKFTNLFDDIQIRGFNHQNAIFGLSITRLERADGPTPYFSVVVEQSFGIGAEFTCTGIEVVSATLCDEDGKERNPAVVR
jgi:immunity protein 50 of polymorphic toxin system